MKQFTNQERAKCRDEQFSAQTYNYPVHLRPFFSDLKDYYKRQSRVELKAAIILSLLSVPLFFIAPVTATCLAVVALLLVAAAACHNDKSKQFDNDVYVETTVLPS